MTRNTNSESRQVKDTAACYSLSADECTRRLGVDPDTGLDTSESAQRLQNYGHNELAAAKEESTIKAFLRQYHSLMHIVLSHDASQHHYSIRPSYRWNSGRCVWALLLRYLYCASS